MNNTDALLQIIHLIASGINENIAKAEDMVLQVKSMNGYCKLLMILSNDESQPIPIRVQACCLLNVQVRDSYSALNNNIS